MRILLQIILILGFSATAMASLPAIDPCYTGFKKASQLKASAAQRLLLTPMTLNTEQGQVTIARTDGYQLKYTNKKGATFVMLRAELSDPAHYGQDTLAILQQLKSMQALSGKDTELQELSYNGFRLYGSNAGQLEATGNLGTFVCFAGNGVILYFDFPAGVPEQRHYETWEDFKGLRNGFFGEYTAFLKNCLAD